MSILLYVVIALVVIFLFSAINILMEYERGVIFTLGRFWKVKGPGLIIVIPIIQRMARVQLRTVVMDVPSQDVISQDKEMRTLIEEERKPFLSVLKEEIGGARLRERRKL